MSKRNKLTYTPANPSFLQELKRQIGLKNEPTVDTKRQRIEAESDSDSDCAEESPQVVVLKKGDLTAEEAEQEQKRIEQEENEKPADLSVPIKFVPRKLANPNADSSDKQKPKEKTGPPKINRNILSFGDDEEDEDDE